MAANRIETEDYAGVTVVKLLDGSLLDAAAIDPVKNELYRLSEQEGRTKLVLDLSRVRQLSSQILGVFTSLNRKCRDAGGSMCLCGVRPELMQMFTITGLNDVLDFHKNDAEALAAHGIHVA